MGAVVGAVLPLALGIAISPIPIIAAILMLLSPRARVTSVGFLIGWVAGIVVAVTLFTALSSVLNGDDSEPSPVAGFAKLALGALMVAVAVTQWRGRPGPGEEPEMPRWMGAIDHMSLPAALGMGALLSGVNPKNLLLAASAGVEIGTGTMDTAPEGTVVVAILVFTALAASTVAIPVVGYLIAQERLRGPLDSLKGWLGANNATIMAVLMLVIGVMLIGRSLAQF
ncbi:GAP family protein [Demequina salsinemoris]|uniref:GAP family protein n=1 Tax=Demequina salsinemoris TaxID=577470 RepID=UPI0007835118|nr:GAP family protein [Demequina salsinemoris]